MKKCIHCGVKKELAQFYKHKGMKDGHLNSCKECVKAYSKINWHKKIKIPEFRESEKSRARDKYGRLYSYGRSKKPSKDIKRCRIQLYCNKYPEKYKARVAISHFVSKKGYHNHHWSYNKKHLKDVIELPIKVHYLIHRFMKYESSKKMYKTLEGLLLDTREKHISYINLVTEMHQNGNSALSVSS